MQSSIAVGISLPTNVIKKIDAERGDIPRSRFVLRILEKVYGVERKIKSEKSDSVESGLVNQLSTEFMDT
jgi:hypothetical protein